MSCLCRAWVGEAQTDFFSFHNFVFLIPKQNCLMGASLLRQWLAIQGLYIHIYHYLFHLLQKFTRAVQRGNAAHKRLVMGVSS